MVGKAKIRRSRLTPVIIRHSDLRGPDFLEAWEEMGRKFNEALGVAHECLHGKYSRVEVKPENLPLHLANQMLPILRRGASVEATRQKLNWDVSLSLESEELSLVFHLPSVGSSVKGRPRKPEFLVRDSKILKLREVDGLSYGRIALKLHATRPAVERAYHRMRNYRGALYRAYLRLKRTLLPKIVKFEMSRSTITPSTKLRRLSKVSPNTF